MGVLALVGVAVGKGSGVGVGGAVGVGVGDGFVVAVGLTLMICPLLPGDGGCAAEGFPLISKTRPIVRKTPQPKPKAMPMRKVSHCLFLGGNGGEVSTRGWRRGIIAFLTSGKPYNGRGKYEKRFRRLARSRV